MRIPRKWASAFHPQAYRPGNRLTYGPGWRGTGMQPMRRVPITAYSAKASGVPLTGGQNQGIIGGIPGGSGSATSPTAFTVLTEVTVPVAGTYTVNWSAALSGTLSGAELNNFGLFRNQSAQLATSVNPAAAGTYPQAPVTVTLAAGDRLEVGNVGNATAGATYTGSITSASAALTLTAGPQGLGTVWYPAQVTLSTTTGALDTSTALIYLGAQGVPITLVASVFSGNGTAALAIPSMSPGQVLIVTWTGGHPGDTAAFNVIGSMDALTTG
jgi:hypothetical protein